MGNWRPSSISVKKQEIWRKLPRKTAPIFPRRNLIWKHGEVCGGLAGCIKIWKFSAWKSHRKARRITKTWKTGEVVNLHKKKLWWTICSRDFALEDNGLRVFEGCGIPGLPFVKFAQGVDAQGIPWYVPVEEASGRDAPGDGCVLMDYRNWLSGVIEEVAGHLWNDGDIGGSTTEGDGLLHGGGSERRARWV